LKVIISYWLSLAVQAVINLGSTRHCER